MKITEFVFHICTHNKHLFMTYKKHTIPSFPSLNKIEHMYTIWSTVKIILDFSSVYRRIFGLRPVC